MQAVDKDSFLRAEAELVLDEARKVKSEQIKDLGEPIQLSGVALDIQVRGNFAWIAENTSVIRKLDLETGKTVQAFRGHNAPATSIEFYCTKEGQGEDDVVIGGSWDKTIKLWEMKSKKLICSTSAHSDFVKALLVIPSLHLLVSSSSDKIIRFWDLSRIEEGKELISVGSITAHTRPVEALTARPLSDGTAILYTADTMGIIKSWKLEKESGPSPRWRTTLKNDFSYHRTKINQVLYGNGQIWTASSDETVQACDDPPVQRKTGEKAMPPIQHPVAARAVLPLALTALSEPYLLTGSGDVIRAYDISSPEEPELLSETDGHWHDVIALRLWTRKSPVTDAAGNSTGQFKVEPWIVSTSLDGTIRKWRLSELLQPTPKPKGVESKPIVPVPKPAASETFGMTEDEERELAELMDD